MRCGERAVGIALHLPNTVNWRVEYHRQPTVLDLRQIRLHRNARHLWRLPSWTRRTHMSILDPCPMHPSHPYRACPHHVSPSTAIEPIREPWTESDQTHLDHLSRCNDPAWMGEVAERASKAIAALRAQLAEASRDRDGVRLIAAERARQEAEEGWTAEHDDTHTQGEMAIAAACYAWPSPRPLFVKQAWPWDREWWKPAIPGERIGFPEEHSADEIAAARIKDLVRAGALIAAEIDRLSRALSPGDAAE
jgi:hypothetical protein